MSPMVAFLLPLLLLLACLLPLSDPPRLLGCVDGIVGRGALTSIGPLERALSGGVEICLDAVGRPPESALKSARRASDGSLPCLVAGVLTVPCHIAHRPGKHNHVWGGAQRRTGNGAQASKSWRQRVCGQPRSPPYRRGYPHAVAFGGAPPATSFK